MEKINIEITKAQLISCEIQFNEEGQPDITANLGLYTDQGKMVSTYSIGTKSWNNNNIELPLGMIQPIMSIGKQIETITTQHCREGQGALAAPTNDF